MELIIVIIILAYLGFAAVHDYLTKSVSDYLSQTLLALGLILSLGFIGWNGLLTSIISAALMFGIGLMFFYAKAWGGGDVKLMSGLAALFVPFLGLKPFLIVLSLMLILGLLYNLTCIILSKVNEPQPYVPIILLSNSIVLLTVL